MTFSWSALTLNQGQYQMDPRRATSVERTLSIARALLVAMGLVGIAMSGSHPEELAVGAFVIITGYLLCSLAFAVYVHVRLFDPKLSPIVHGVDVVWTVLMTSVTGGAASPFFAMFVFMLLASAFRWGRRETVLTGLAAVGILIVQAGITKAIALHSPYPPSLVLIRVTYFAVAALLIGALAETERRSGRISQAVTRVMSRVRAEAGVIGSVQAVVDEFVEQFGAKRAVLLLDEEGNDRVFLWQAESVNRRRGHVRLNQVRREEAAAYTFKLPGSVDVFCASRQDDRGPATTLVALDESGHRSPDAVNLSSLEALPTPWRTIVGVASMAGEGWSGRLFLFDPIMPGKPDDHLQFLQSLAKGVGPALFNLYLQRRLASRTGVVERARISRELHDGVIQSLIGIEMQIEVMRREWGSRLPPAVTTQLTNVQALLSQEILNVRDLMQLLRPVEVDSRRFVEHLAEILDRFRQRTGIDARLVCTADELDLAPRVLRELSAVVQEALANVRKHSGASDVLVRLEGQSGCWQIEIDDNGKGFDFDGHLDQEELDALRRGPVVIKERVRALGGRLAIHSQPGFGSRLSITIPRKRHV